ncbi:MAG: GntR family transcriptional regulator [Pseudomonadota bacterium]
MADTSALPKYIQTAEILVREIASGRLADGAKLAPEREMAAEMGVAVGTLRKALSDLTEKGLLERRQGSGNYVRHRSEATGVYAFFRLEALEGGGLPTAEVLDISKQAKPTDLPRFGAASVAHRIRRLRHIAGRPAAVEEIWLDGGWTETVQRSEILESLYLYYRTKLGLWITRAEDRIGIGTVPGWAPPAFGVAVGAPCGFIERRSRADTGEVAEYSRTWFNAQVARYVTRMR